MTRKDYIKLARIIKDNKLNDTKYLVKDSFIEDLCDVLKQNNINFDRLRFIDACNGHR